jgi:hypothetical protein
MAHRRSRAYLVRRRALAVATAPPPKINRITVSAHLRSVLTSGLTEAARSVPGLVGSTNRAPY